MAEFPKTQSIDEFLDQAAKPNTLFHGTPVPWKNFSLEAKPFRPDSNWFGPGLYLTPARQLAKEFAEYGDRRSDIEGVVDPQVYSFEANEGLNLLDLTKNPSKEVKHMFDDALGPGISTDIPAQASFVNYLTDSAQMGDEKPLLKFISNAKSKGYHGLKWKEGFPVNMSTGQNIDRGFEARVYFDPARAVKPVGQIPLTDLTRPIRRFEAKPGVKSEVHRIAGEIGQIGRVARMQNRVVIYKGRQRAEKAGAALVNMLHRAKSSGRF